jgi:hypothetical protein
LRPRERTDFEIAVENNGHQARRLVESDELLTSEELERASTQLRLVREHRSIEAREQVAISQEEALNRIRNVRAWLVTTMVAVTFVAGGIAALTGRSPHISLTQAWRDVASNF